MRIYIPLASKKNERTEKHRGNIQKIPVTHLCQRRNPALKNNPKMQAENSQTFRKKHKQHPMKQKANIQKHY
ncbi:hypothetical protein FM107_10500 [Sphingobacterium sp. JB170]|nr:hypothetical protein FM107_10500 [Sphingobacterium sp. JB170]